MNALERSQLREERHRHQPRRKTPSFSSSLLDAIYRSTDDSKCEEEADDSSVLHRETATTTRTKKQSDNALEDEETLRRAIMIEKWSRSSWLYNSTSSSSESSGGGVFSSSETETCYRDRSKPTSFTVQRPKQVRGGVLAKPKPSLELTPKREASLMRTKSKALKIYGDLKKVKQPISPGRRITNLLNSLFNSRNVKSAKNRETMEDLSSVRKSRSVKDSTTCSFSSYCLPPSRAKLGSNNGSKRSVRFYPVPVIIDEDCRPCGHKCVYEGDPSLMPTPIVRKIAETRMLKNMRARELRNFQEEEDDDDDVESCTSSDLFELENIGAIGVGTYREELPVYGTTSLKAHHAIANGLIL